MPRMRKIVCKVRTGKLFDLLSAKVIQVSKIITIYRKFQNISNCNENLLHWT